MMETKSKFKKVRMLLDASEDLSILWATTLSSNMPVNDMCWFEENTNKSRFFLYVLPCFLYSSNNE